MGAKPRPSFEFKNHISPRHVETLLLHISYGEWYDTEQLKGILHASGLDVEGTEIVNSNSMAWSLIGLGEARLVREGRSVTKLFQLNPMGKQVVETYSTNRPLFFDLMHFFFYSAWPRSKAMSRARFWLYASVCDALWSEAPAQTDAFALTNRLQLESRDAFPDYDPTFPAQAVRAVFPWLGALDPPFLSRLGARSQLHSNRRNYCSPQLFHLATDLIYLEEGLRYGTSMAIDETHIESVSRICLLDTGRFWQMADLAKMTVRGYDIRKGQWGTSIALEGPPAWIELPELVNGASEADQEDT
jgi:hypothetical protein